MAFDGAEADDLLYNYDGINSAAEAVRGFINQVQANLSEVEENFNTLRRQGWTEGMGIEAFEPARQKWQAAMTDINTVFMKYETTTHDVSAQMKATDIKAATYF